MKKDSKYNVLFFLLILCLGYFVCNYLYISIYDFPLMDFWNGGAEKIEKVMNNQVGIGYFFPIPHVLHANSLFAVYDWVMTKYFACNVVISMYLGGIFLTLCAVVVWREYLGVIKKVTCREFLLMVLCVLPIFNLNQWEIMTLSCSVAFFFRIFIYMLYFCVLSQTIRHRSWDEGKAIGLAISGILIICLMSQAYFPAFVVTIIVTLLFDYIVSRERTKEQLRCYLIVAGGNVVGTIMFLATLQTSGAGEPFAVTASWILDFFKGIILMLGAIVVPVASHAEGLQKVYLWGSVILVLALLCVLLYFRYKMYYVSYFPIQCMMYAFGSILTITYGRLTAFGLRSLASSRYVVETVMGLVGVGLILAYSVKQIKAVSGRWGAFYKNIFVRSFVAFLGVNITVLFWTNKVEMVTGPYRKIYKMNMVALAENADQATDEELGIFQAPAQDVRECITVMKKYKMSVWSDK